MNDERAVEVMAARMRLNDEPVDSRRLADLLLAALEAAGYAIYRPGECATVFVDSCRRDHEGCRVVDEHVPQSPPGAYSLVPEGGDS